MQTLISLIGHTNNINNIMPIYIAILKHKWFFKQFLIYTFVHPNMKCRFKL